MMSPVSDEAWKAQLEALEALVRAQRLAADLSLRELSARTHVSKILAKLGLSSRTQAALWAARHADDVRLQQPPAAS